MELEYRVGSLLDATERVIAHGCNDKGTFGAGVAGLIAQRWPTAKQTYDFAIAGGAGLGHVSWAPVEDGRWIANVITQHGYGRDPRVRYVRYDAVDTGMRQLVLEKNLRFPEASIAIPAIGAGLGNGSWRVVREILRKVSDDTGTKFVIYSLESIQELNA